MRSKVLPALAFFVVCTVTKGEWRRIDISAEIRSRFEPLKKQPFHDLSYRSVFRSRVRLEIGARISPWVRGVLQAQDAETLPDRSDGDHFGLRQVFAEVGPEASEWRGRVGRQELAFGPENLVGADAEWCSLGRVFDAARLTWTRGRVQVDAFAGGLVEQTYPSIGRSPWQDTLYGLYAAVTVPGVRVEPFLLVKGGDGRSVRTLGAHVEQDLPEQRFAFSADAAVQRNSGATAAAAGVGVERSLGTAWTFGVAAKLATGGRGEGGWGTFDDLYPSGYNDFGILDTLAWRNLREISAIVRWRPAKRLEAATGYSRSWLFDPQAGVFVDDGDPVLIPSPKSPAAIGGQINAAVRFAITPPHEIVAGFSAFQPAAALANASHTIRGGTVYLAWRTNVGRRQQEPK